MVRDLTFMVGVAFVLASSGRTQSGNDLVGTWRLVAAVEKGDNGDVRQPFGVNPMGLLTYSADGRMAVIITNAGRKPLSTDDRIAAPASERAEAYSTMLAYAGRYSLNRDAVVHHVEVASVQNWAGTDLVRYVKRKGNLLILVRAAGGRAGGRQLGTTELVWERVHAGQ